MDDLFEKLKSEPAVNSSKDEISKLKPPLKKISTDDISTLPRREKSASPVLNFNRSRSNSPSGNGEQSKSTPVDISLEDSSEPPAKIKRSSPKDSDAEDVSEASSFANKGHKNKMPTKAQQKQFEPPTVEDSKDGTGLKAMDTKVKRCRVRIKREDLVKLREKFSREQAAKKSKKNKTHQNKTNKLETPTKTIQKAGIKRKADTGGSPPAKKGKSDAKSTSSPPGKKATGFFIKLNTPLNKKMQRPSRGRPPLNSTKKSPQPAKEKVLRKTLTRLSNSVPVFTTKATKFTRSQLIRTFGKRYFSSRVRIERCRHPMMLTFESNARARKLQAKNKSKNLSVSFKEQVEIIGLSDTESNESEDANVTANAKGAEKLLAGATPLHLKKVENGKVIDDIEFDPTMFGDPNSGKNSSTPLRKKKEKKSYSPLKDDSSSSARSELLKSANEKLPPSALRRLSAEDEDDEDDECEWIVPIDLPERRSSRNNSISEKDERDSDKEEESEAQTSVSADKNKIEVLATENAQTEAVDKKTTQPERGNLNEAKNDTAVENKSMEGLNGDDVEKDTGNGKTIRENEDPKKDAEDELKDTKKNTKDAEDKEKNTQATKNDSENTEKEQLLNEAAKNDFPALVLENESSSATPNPPFTPENHDSPDLLKTAIDRLAEDIERNESDCKEVSDLNKPTVVESA